MLSVARIKFEKVCFHLRCYLSRSARWQVYLIQEKQIEYLIFRVKYEAFVVFLKIFFVKSQKRHNSKVYKFDNLSTNVYPKESVFVDEHCRWISFLFHIINSNQCTLCRDVSILVRLISDNKKSRRFAKIAVLGKKTKPFPKQNCLFAPSVFELNDVIGSYKIWDVVYLRGDKSNIKFFYILNRFFIKSQK